MFLSRYFFVAALALLSLLVAPVDAVALVINNRDNSKLRTQLRGKANAKAKHAIAPPCTCDCCHPGQLATGNPQDRVSECV